MPLPGTLTTMVSGIATAPPCLPSALRCRIITRLAEVGSAASLTGLPVGPSSELVTRNVWPEPAPGAPTATRLATFTRGMLLATWLR